LDYFPFLLTHALGALTKKNGCFMCRILNKQAQFKNNLYHYLCVKSDTDSFAIKGTSIKESKLP